MSRSRSHSPPATSPIGINPNQFSYVENKMFQEWLNSELDGKEENFAKMMSNQRFEQIVKALGLPPNVKILLEVKKKQLNIINMLLGFMDDFLHGNQRVQKLWQQRIARRYV